MVAAAAATFRASLSTVAVLRESSSLAAAEANSASGPAEGAFAGAGVGGAAVSEDSASAAGAGSSCCLRGDGGAGPVATVMLPAAGGEVDWSRLDIAFFDNFLSLFWYSSQ